MPNLLSAYCDDSDSDNDKVIIKKYEKQNIDQPVSSNTDNDVDDDATKQVSFASSSSSSQPAKSYPTLYLCEICHIDSHKYRCPSCLMKTWFLKMLNLP